MTWKSSVKWNGTLTGIAAWNYAKFMHLSRLLSVEMFKINLQPCGQEWQSSKLLTGFNIFNNKLNYYYSHTYTHAHSECQKPTNSNATSLLSGLQLSFCFTWPLEIPVLSQETFECPLDSQDYVRNKQIYTYFCSITNSILLIPYYFKNRNNYNINCTTNNFHHI